MSDKKLTAKASGGNSEEAVNDSADPQRTLLTLDQLSQTIDVMSSVVNRLRSHLSEQLSSAQSLNAAPQTTEASPQAQKRTVPTEPPSLVIEISSELSSSSDAHDHTSTIH